MFTSKCLAKVSVVDSQLRRKRKEMMEKVFKEMSDYNAVLLNRSEELNRFHYKHEKHRNHIRNHHKKGGFTNVKRFKLCVI